jgi:hypothetical protein
LGMLSLVNVQQFSWQIGRPWLLRPFRRYDRRSRRSHRLSPAAGSSLN